MGDVLQVWAASHVGRVRAHNEDRCRTSVWQMRGIEETWHGRMPSNGSWALVADGMGGHGAGEVASETAVGALASLLPAARSEADIWDAIRRANDRVYDAMTQPEGRLGMGTTIVGVTVHAGSCTVFNVGDSRAYVVRRGVPRILTVDDTPEWGLSVARRSHALTQSLGGTPSRRPIRPHVNRVEILPGDRLLLCTDGLTDLVDDDGIATVLRRVHDNPASALVDSALLAGGRDNVTVVVIEF